jgi:hypothetical protein
LHMFNHIGIISMSRNKRSAGAASLWRLRKQCVSTTTFVGLNGFANLPL